MKHSVGLILSTFVLGAAALGMLGMGAMMGFAALAMRMHPVPQQAAAPALVLLATAAFLLALAAWCIATLVGLLMLRVWARYSVLVMGGLWACALFGSVGVMIALVSGQLDLATARPGVDPRAMHMVFYGIAVFYALVGACGIWWLVYFNLEATKQQFRLRERRDPRTGLILPPPEPSRRPTAITVLACFLLMGTMSYLLYACLPVPMLQFGMVLTGRAARIGYGAFSLVSAVLAVGLWRLRPLARVGTMVLCGVWIANIAAMLLPATRPSIERYQEQFHAALATFGLPVQQTHPHTPFVVTAVVLTFSLGLSLFCLWLLHRHRAAFTPPVQDYAAT